MRALVIALMLLCTPALAQEAETEALTGLDKLFSELRDAGPEETDWKPIQNRIVREFGRSGSDTADLLLSRGRKAMEAGRLTEAVSHLSRLVSFAPDFAEGWNTRATVYYLQEDYGRSLADIQRTLRLEPRHFGALSGMGIILERLGRQETALDVYRRALEVHPNMPGAKAAFERLEKKVGGRDV